MQAKIVLDTGDYEDGINSAKKKSEDMVDGLDSIGSSADKSAGKTKTFAEVLKANLLSQVIVQGVTKLANGFKNLAKDVVSTGNDFDQSMSQVAATMAVPVESIGNLREAAIEYGETTAFTATEVSQAFNYMALAGYDAETSLKMLPNVLNLAAAGSIDLAYASDMITDSQSALNLTVDETTALVDQMAKTASKSNTSVSQLGDAILTVGGTASYMAGGTEQINTVLGILADNGIKGTEAGTHLRNMLLSLSAPTDDAAALIKDLNVEIFDADGKMRDFSDIFPELNAAMADFTDQQKLDAFSTLFNSRDIASATALLQTSTERWEELGNAIVDSGGAAQAMADTQLDNLSGDLTILNSALEGAKIRLYDGVSPALRDAAQAATQFVSNIDWSGFAEKISGFISAIIDNGPTIITIISSIAVAFVGWNVGSMIGGLIKSISALGGILPALQAGIQGVNAAFAANPIGAVIAVVGVLITALVTLWNTNEGFRDAVKKIWDTIKGVFIGAWDAIKAVWSTVAGFFSGVWNAIKSVFSAVSSVLTGFFSAAWNGIKGVWNAATGYFQNIWNTIKGIFSVVKSVLSGDFSGAWEAIKGIFNGWGSYFTGIWNNVKNIFKSAIDKLKSFFHFDWSLPKIKLPHFSITGKFSLSPPSIPHISVSWYKKAMDNAMLLNDPTIFGMSGNTFLGAGEAGPEVVSGADTLMNMISKSVKSAMGTPVINITVNGANIHNDRKLAEEIALEFQRMYNRKAAVFGT